MTTHLRWILLFATALFTGWPSMLQAGQAETVQSASAATSFLLVASQQMPDPRFRRAVIVVTQHGKSGPIGVIVNRPEGVTLDRLFPDYPAAGKMNLFDGGPAYPREISYLVRGAGNMENALSVTGNVYLAYDLPVLETFLKGTRAYTGLRVMHGLASWAPGQLESEIKQGSWFVMEFDEAAIFDRPPEAMWQELQSHAATL